MRNHNHTAARLDSPIPIQLCAAGAVFTESHRCHVPSGHASRCVQASCFVAGSRAAGRAVCLEFEVPRRLQEGLFLRTRGHPHCSDTKMSAIPVALDPKHPSNHSRATVVRRPAWRARIGCLLSGSMQGAAALHPCPVSEQLTVRMRELATGRRVVERPHGTGRRLTAQLTAPS